MRDLVGKLALVTGGAKNVGKVIARRLSERGADVIINYFHSHEAAKQTKSELETTGSRVEVMRASVAQKHQVDQMFDEIERKYGYLDILVNNAASGAFVPSSEVAEEHFARAIDTNLKGSFWCARHAARLMAKRGGGTIVNVSSVGAGLVPANYVVVGTSKAAVEALTRYLAVEYAPLNIRVNTASASMIEGDVARLFPQYQEMRQSSVEHTPLGRLATAEDLAGVVMFLTSDDSRWVTGQVILADGGLSLSSVALSPARNGNQLLVASTADSENRVVLSSPPEEAGTTEIARDGAEIEDTEDIAVVGMGLAVPGANSPEEFWRVLMEGPDLFRNVPPDRWDYSSFYSTDATAGDKSYQSRSVFIDSFRPAEELREDPAWAAKTCEFTTLWLRHSLVQALREVKRKPDDRFSFVVGYTADGSQHLEEAAVLSGALYRWRQVLANISAEESAKEELLGRIESVLKERYWRGASDASRYLPHKVGRNAMTGVLPDHTSLMMVDTACSSSLYAVDIAVKGLLTGEHDVAVCGGAFALAPRGSVLFAKLHGLSESGEVRPLDRRCDGVLFADGAGVVVLKRLKRALADGDRILAVIKAFGASSDGKGKAIYAPSSAGQEIAIERALAHPSVSLEHIDWVVAHATGTPAGDMAEFTTLRQKMVSDHTIYVTSNKSLIGHTGWSAGVASLIEVILGLEKQMIPPQHRFEQPPAEFGIESTNLKIPTAPVPWPRKQDVPRAASVSGFGFGGTNAHLVVQDYAPGAASPGPKRSYAERLVIVGWSAHLPGILEDAEITAWIKGAGSAPALSFGDSYPMPSFEHVRMPPGTVRSIDRCQLMILECARKLKTQLKSFWEIHAERIGVLMGHMGPTRNATLYASRCYMDDMRGAFAANPALNHAPMFEEAFSAFSKEIERLIPQSNENSFPGMMPNVIPARVANYFDLKGLNMTVDTGFSSALTAIETAGRYLRSGELEMALVGGINGNTTPEMAHFVGNPGVALAEGAFLFALTLESVAREAGLTILAHVDPAGEPSSSGCHTVIECGAASKQGRNYLGAEGALAILKSLLSDSSRTDVICRTDDSSHDACLRISSALAPRDERQAPATVIPAQFQEPAQCAPGRPLEVRRHVAVLEPKPLERIRAGIEFFAPGTLVVTNTPEIVERATNQEDVFILSTEPFASTRPNRFHIPEITEETVSQVLKALPLQLCHLRLVTDLCASSPAGACLEVEPKSLVDLHDLTFLALKYGFDGLSGANTSFVSLFLDATPHGSLHPFAGFFGGMIKSSALELPSCLVVGVYTSSTDLAEGVRQADAETTAKRLLPIVVYVDGIRKTFFLDAATGELPPSGEARLDRDSVVVATAGARGITAELLKAVARHFQPRLYLIGSNRLDQYPPEIFEATDEQFASTRAVYLRQQKTANPSKSVGVINKEFERMAEARLARRNIAEMEKHCGPGRVRYIACDVLDRDAVVRTIGQILQTEERIDLLINAAGLNRSASIPAKSLKDFRTVRDIKLRGYQNLKYALRERPPKMWCNFGSFIGFTGQLGEADYSSANDLLATSAAYAREVLKQDEYTIGWTLWRSVGLGANPVTQAFLEKSGLFTSMSTEEGIHHFIRETNLARHDASIIHLGAPEKKAIQDYIPDFFGARLGTSTFRDSRETGRFYLGTTISSTQDEIVFERIFDLERDGYLQHHVVNGYATLPGTFVPEVAAEVALQLVPGTKVIALQGAKFTHFLRVYEKSRPSPKKISARIVERIGEYSVVQVRILTDIAAPNGKLLAKDKLHFEIRVVLGHDYPSAPYWERWGGTGEIPVPDPYHFAVAPVLLTGPFVSTRDTRQHPFGKRATYDLKVESDDPVFSSFLLPSIMLDGLARIAVLNHVEEDYIPLAAPASIRRIDIYEAGNDCELAERYEQIEFYATPREFALEGENGGNRFVAVRPDGHMIMQMKDVTGVVVGYVHRTTGEFMSAEQMKERQAGAMALAGASRR